MIKKIFFFLCLCIICNDSFAQTPSIHWQSTYGGTNTDYGSGILQTPDTGFIVIGETYSNDDEVAGYLGGGDIWVIKITSTGMLTWKKCYGGSNNEQSTSIMQTKDGNYLLAGTTNSTDGEITSHFGNYDGWIVKIDDTGKILWQHNYGGSDTDGVYCVKQTLDGGYLAVCSSTSTDGQVTGNHGDLDFWIIKLNDSGGFIWGKSFGGTNDDVPCMGIQLTPDSGYIIAGMTTSSDGDVTGYHGGLSDYWVIKINDTGGLVWERTYGGSGDDEAESISPATGGGYIISGLSNSIDGDITGNHGGYDVWTVKINDTGGIVWENSYGGNDNEGSASIIQTSDSGYLMTGYTFSNDANVFGNHGNGDVWVVKTDSLGNMQWQKCMGGDSLDIGICGIQTFNGEFELAGYTKSTNGDITHNYGGYDTWLVQLGSPPTSISTITTIDNIEIYPVPADELLHIKLPVGGISAQLQLYDILGRQLSFKSGQNDGLTRVIYLGDLSPGIYILRVTNGDTINNFRIVHN